MEEVNFFICLLKQIIRMKKGQKYRNQKKVKKACKYLIGLVFLQPSLILFIMLMKVEIISQNALKNWRITENSSTSQLYNQYFYNTVLLNVLYLFKFTVNMDAEDEMLLDNYNNHKKEESNETKQISPYLYGWGRNDEGQLGIKQAKALLPTPSKGFRGYAKQIASARGHTIILNEEGHIYLSGSVLFGRIGISSNSNNIRTFQVHQIMQQHVVKKIACGDYHTLALIDDGTIFSWGGTLYDKTGHKSGIACRIEKLVGQQIVDISCGDFHSIALNSVGKVYSWGGGGQNKNKGQLGHSNKKDLSNPEQIKFFSDKKVVKIACGYYHTMVLTQSGDLYAFGQGNMGQLGTGGKEDCPTPKKVKLNFQLALEQYFRSDINEETRIQQIALGGHHSLLLTNKGHVYVCGYGSQGQLGLGQGQTDNKYEPTLVKILLGKQIKMIAAGGTHSLALSSNHDVYSCGYNAKGQLGIGEEKSVTVWTHITALSGKNIAQIYAGGDHSWAVIDKTSPFIKNYEPPSPIKAVFDEPTIIKHNQSSRPQKSAFSNNSMDEILVSLTPTRKLELIVTQVEMSHRFIHFVVKENYPNWKKKIDDYINYVYQNEKSSMKYHRVTQDGDMFDSKGKQILSSNSKGSTIMMVCEIPQDATQYLLSKNKTSIGIGQLYMMDSVMLKTENNKIPNHNLWFFKFHEIFDDMVERARFIELRPKFI